MLISNIKKLSSSFRDPNGFLFTANGKLFRQINQSYEANFSQLINSGLYETLTKTGLLIQHEETNLSPPAPDLAFKVIQPKELPFISYPYEWSFSFLKDAALSTLIIQNIALEAGMNLKDASAYNMQMVDGKIALIDTLSFEIYQVGSPWVAYRQFCQHFLAPLALMAYTDIRLSQLMRIYIDGIPLDLASRLLPSHTWLNFGLFTHIHLHAKAQQKFANRKDTRIPLSNKISKQSLAGLIESLETTINKMDWKPGGTEWGDYYSMTNYNDTAFKFKKDIVSSWVNHIKPKFVWDFGANDGTYSRIASDKGIITVAFDIDPTAVDKNYRQIKSTKDFNLIPLVLDLTNPSPSIGWHNKERDSLLERGPADLVIALALIHHLAISNNVPLESVASFFAAAGKWAIVEFVPKSDSQVKHLLSTRKDIFDFYYEESFEKAFRKYFTMVKKEKVQGSERLLYLFKNNR